MKKVYETPLVEKVDFDYKNQVVASGGGCYYRNIGDESCESGGEFILENS